MNVDDSATPEAGADSDEIPEPTHPALHDLLGFEFELPDLGSRIAEVRMPVAPAAMGSVANIHGGAIATLVDLACALAAARCRGFDPARETLVTADMHVRYLGKHRADEVLARAEVVKVGNHLIVVECKVISGVGDDDGEHVIAVADFSMMVVPRRLPGPDAPPPGGSADA